MKKSSLNPSASFDSALIDLVRQCRVDRSDIEDARARMNQRLPHFIRPPLITASILPLCVRLLTHMKQTDDGTNDINYARQEEIDAAYRPIVNGGLPVMPSRVDTELDKVMSLITNDKPPKIDDIMKAISCSRGKAHKLRAGCDPARGERVHVHRNRVNDELSEIRRFGRPRWHPLVAGGRPWRD